MISILGVSDSKEDIVNSFVLINRGADVALVDNMELVMEESDVEYIKTTAPKVCLTSTSKLNTFKSGSGFDFNGWTEDVFSR